MLSPRVSLAAALLSCAGLTGALWAQVGVGAVSDDGGPGKPRPATWPSHDEALAFDTGAVGHDGSVDGPMVVFSDVVHVPGAVWVRLRFDLVQLSGDPGADGAFLRVTSLRDLSSQVLDAEHAAQWANSSAYFNGEDVLLEVVAHPGTGPCRVVMSRVTAGDLPRQDRSICGATDDRTLLTDNRTARHSIGCTSWLINDFNTMFLTAGHCGAIAGDVMMFNVPLSDSSGGLVNPPASDQYVVDATSTQFVNGGVGNDWCYFGVFANSTTGLTPYQAYGQRYTLGNAPASGTQTIRVTGFGTVSAPVSLTWNQAGKTHTGAYAGLSGTNVRYKVDTTGGNSGSPVFNEPTQTAIGIHTHAGCDTTSTSYNNGTAVQLAGLQAALANPLGICRSGKATAGGPLYVGGDQVNNFGTASTSTGVFGRVSVAPALIHGLAYNRVAKVFYAVDLARKLYTVDPASGAFTLLGTVSGITVTLNGLGYDPVGNVLYAIAQSNGRLYTINTTTLAATAVGAAAGGTVGALEWDSLGEKLYGLDDAGGTKLVTINTATGARTVVGSLGAGITDCNGLAYKEDEDAFYTINTTTEQLVRVNKLTGAATVVGATQGMFGSGQGMACVNKCPSDFNGDGFVSGEDFDQFIGLFVAGDQAADFDRNTFVTGDDFDGFVIAFERGC